MQAFSYLSLPLSPFLLFKKLLVYSFQEGTLRCLSAPVSRSPASIETLGRLSLARLVVPTEAWETQYNGCRWVDWVLGWATLQQWSVEHRKTCLSMYDHPQSEITKLQGASSTWRVNCLISFSNAINWWWFLCTKERTECCAGRRPQTKSILRSLVSMEPNFQKASSSLYYLLILQDDSIIMPYQVLNFI